MSEKRKSSVYYTAYLKVTGWSEGDWWQVRVLETNDREFKTKGIATKMAKSAIETFKKSSPHSYAWDGIIGYKIVKVTEKDDFTARFTKPIVSDGKQKTMYVNAFSI